MDGGDSQEEGTTGNILGGSRVTEGEVAGGRRIELISILHGWQEHQLAGGVSASEKLLRKRTAIL